MPLYEVWGMTSHRPGDSRAAQRHRAFDRQGDRGVGSSWERMASSRAGRHVMVGYYRDR